jgi:hypothetical protein
MSQPAGGRRAARIPALLLVLALVACATPEAPTASPIPPAPTATPASTAPPSATPAPPTPRPSATLPPPTATPPAPTAPPTPATSSATLRQALAAMAAVTSYHYTATIQTFDNGHNLLMATEGDYHAPDALEWSTRAGEITTTAIVTGNLLYVSVGAGAWTTLPGAAQERDRQMLWTLIGQARAVAEVDRDPPTDPEPSIHYSFTLPLDALPLEPHPWQVAQGDVWLDQADHRVRALKIYAQEPTYETTQRFFLSAFDAPVAIRAPSATPAQQPLSGDLLYAHYSAGAGESALRVRDLTGGGEETLPAVGGAVTGGAWAPDGRQVICSAGGTLYLVDPDNGRAENLGRGLSPVWSQDGLTILFARGSSRWGAPWASDPLLNTPRRLNDYAVDHLDLAPDGAHVLFSGWAPSADPTADAAQLFVMNMDGTGVRRLADLAGGFAWPRWSPDGARIAVVAGGKLGVMDADGTHLTLLDEAGQARAPVWSPDGADIVYAWRGAGGATPAIMARPADGGPAETLTTGDDLPLDWK